MEALRIEVQWSRLVTSSPSHDEYLMFDQIVRDELTRCARGSLFEAVEYVWEKAVVHWIYRRMFPAWFSFSRPDERRVFARQVSTLRS